MTKKEVDGLDESESGLENRKKIERNLLVIVTVVVVVKLGASYSYTLLPFTSPFSLYCLCPRGPA